MGFMLSIETTFCVALAFIAGAFLAAPLRKLMKYLFEKKSPKGKSVEISISSPVETKNDSEKASEQSEETFEESLAALEKARGSKIIFLSHSIGSSSSSAFGGLMGSKNEIGYNDALQFVEIFRKIPNDQNVDIILNTPGGSFAATEIIVNALLNHMGTVQIFVPFCAYSGGTLIALTGDHIFLGRNASLGPVDGQRFGFSVPSLYRKIPTGNDGMFSFLWQVLRDQFEKDIGRTHKLMKRIQTRHQSDFDLPTDWSFEDCQQIDNVFVSATNYDHDQPLFFQDLSCVRNLVKEIPDEIYNIYEQFQKKNIKPSSGGLFSGLL
jgi:ATP-dependent protease ClpP protease subunit